MLDALLVHNAVQKLQLLALVVEALHFIPVIHFDHEFDICLQLDDLPEADALGLRLAECSTQYVRGRPPVLVARRHTLRCCIEESLTLEDGSLLNERLDVVIVDFTLWELHRSDATVHSNELFGV